MPETVRLSRAQLESLYSRPSWQQAFNETRHIVNFLNNCILSEGYKIPDSAVQLVPLTEYGTSVLNRLVRKHEVNAKVARLLCLLKMVHREPLVEFNALDTDTLRQFVDAQIRDGSILLPFILGRDLYDQAGQLFEDARPSLSHIDTLNLLSKLPVGVFQSGRYVSGPFGLLKSQEDRWLTPDADVPMYHCAEITCNRVHRTRLSSDFTSPILAAQVHFRQVLDHFGEDESDWGEFLEKIQETDGIEYEDRAQEPIVLALSDLLADSELRSLLSDVLDYGPSNLRKAIAPLGLLGPAPQLTETLDRAQCIQILLLTKNSVLCQRLDALIRRPSPRDSEEDDLAPRIEVAPGEVRKLMTNARTSFGVFALYPEISALGLRFKSDVFSLAPMRLKRLVSSLYDMEDPDELAELGWQLRSVEGTEPQDQIEEFVQSVSPERVIDRLILSRRSNQELAARELGLDYEDFDTDQNFVEAALWKLGFYGGRSRSVTDDFWEAHARLGKAVDTASVGARVDLVDLRSRAVNCFVALEGVLHDALSYSTWALTTDHLSAARPFAYAPWREQDSAYQRLNVFHADGKLRTQEQNRLARGSTLGPLINGFGLLAEYLGHASAHPFEFDRPEDDFPRFSKFTSLKRFPFRSKVPFVDLLESSQARILESLESVRLVLERADIPTVRNDFSHYRSTTPDLTRVGSALSAMESAVRRLEIDGLVRLPFDTIRSDEDDWGRKIFLLRNSRDREVAFMRPSAYDWAQMPSLRGKQYVLTSAVFARPNEMLRFRLVHNTPYSEYWTGFPRRRRRHGTAAGGEPGGATGPIVASS